MASGKRITVLLETHPIYGLLLLTLKSGSATLRTFISGSPLSGIAGDRWQELLQKEYLVYPSNSDTRYVLDRLSIGDTTISKLEVRRSRRAGRFGLDGELGLNFFQKFREVCYQLPTEPDKPIILTLEEP